MLATVRNKKGAFVRDLGKDDFSVLENGRPQTIRYFSRQTDLPLTLGLMIDTSLSQRRVMDAERIASYTLSGASAAREERSGLHHAVRPVADPAPGADVLFPASSARHFSA